MATTEDPTMQIEGIVDATDTVAAPAPSPTLAAGSIELPPFLPTDPLAWFLEVKVQFNIH